MTPNNTNASGAKENSSTAQVKTVDNDMQEYIDSRRIVISPVKNYSNYRRVNIAALGPKKEVIGSSIRSSQILASNAKELEAYFPSIVGLSPNNPDFVTAVKTWLSNIQIIVNDSNLELNISFIYKAKKYYDSIKEKEDAINREYEKVDRSNIASLKKALNRKIESLNTLESSKCEYGRPENVVEYLIYRHCLLYNDVAKDIAVINSDPTIRFYIKDEAKEAEKTKKLIIQKTKAMKNFVELGNSRTKFNSIYVAICVYNGYDLSQYLSKEDSEKDAIVMDFVNNNPDKFNKFIEDKHTALKADIETLIAAGELRRSDFNQQIALPDGTFVGANMNDAIAWFENPDNKEVRTVLENKLKLL